MLETVPNDPSRRALALAPLDGGEPQRIAENVPPSATWAPDARSFVYLDALSSSIIQVHVDDGRRTELRRFDDMQNYPFMLFAWGSDGRTLFYTKTGAGKSELRRLDLATGDEQTLAAYEGDPQPLVVLP